MIIKGIIEQVDLLGNTCRVRLPFFESAGGDKVVCDSTISIPPGIYGGFREGDVVMVAFEDGLMSKPVIIGRLFLGDKDEETRTGGVVRCDALIAKGHASIPASSEITSDPAKDVANPAESATAKKRLSELNYVPEGGSASEAYESAPVKIGT